MLLDIVILPPKRLRDKLGRTIKQATKEYATIFVVDNKTFIPHSSLFHIRMAKQRLQKLVEAVQKTTKVYKPVKIHSLSFYTAGPYFSLRLSNNKALTSMHKTMVSNCRRLRTGMMPWTGGKRQPTKLELYYRRTYGTQHILKNFNPHFTLAGLKDEQQARTLLEKMKPMKFSFVADTVAITEVNFWHQVTRTIKKFKLRG